MLPGDYVKEHRDKLMANPERYIALLRRMNVLHSVWHVELQERIEFLETALRLIKDEEGRVCEDFELCTHRACQSSCAAWFIAEAALNGEVCP